MWDEPLDSEKSAQFKPKTHHERCDFMKTVRRWSWKSKTAKECVTTH